MSITKEQIAKDLLSIKAVFLKDSQELEDFLKVNGVLLNLG